MTKLKNHSSAKKRFKATGSGLKMRSSGRNHILSKHSTKKAIVWKVTKLRASGKGRFNVVKFELNIIFTLLIE